MPTQFGLCAEDQGKYGCPQWVTYDKDRLDDIPFDELDPWDREMLDVFGCSINELLTLEFMKSTGRSIKGLVWLACKMNGVDVGKLADFNIRTRKVRMRAAKAGDAGPPLPSSSDMSSEESPSETASES
jgi:hypothetical protein